MKLRYEWPNFEAFYSDFESKLDVWTKKSTAEVMSQIRLGWKDEDEAFKLFKLISGEVRAHIPKTVAQRSVSGGTLRVPALLAGRPDHFVRNVAIADVADNRKGKQMIRLCVNVDAIGGVGPALFKLRGAAAIALAEALEASGKRVEITLAIASAPLDLPGGKYAGAMGQHDPLLNQRYYVVVKPFSSPVSPLLHTFPLMSPYILRTLFFAFWAVGLPADEERKFYQGSAGMVGKVVDHNADLYLAEFGAYNAGSYKDVEGAKAWVIEQMKAFGLDIKAGQ